MLTLNLIKEACTSLNGKVRVTPVEESPVLSEHLGVPVWLKLENLQVTGSFKARGALFSLIKCRDRGQQHVATCSAGNHGRGLAWASQQTGVRVTIFVPSGVDATKFDAMQRMGADVRKSAFFGYDETEAWAQSEAESMGIPFVSAYDDDFVMAANGGMIADEVHRQLPEAREFVMPVGGGGHAGGFAFYMKSVLPDSRIIACQHADSAGFLRSVEAGEPILELPPIRTLASGLEGGFGIKTYDVLKDRYDDIRLVNEEELRRAMRWMMEHHQMIVEGSSAVTIAALLHPDFPKPTAPLVAFLSGRNVAFETVREVMNQDDLTS
jgi:threonine dehydratase